MTILSNQTADIPENVSIALIEQDTQYCEGAQSILWRDFSHINVELCLRGKKKRLQIDKWWGNRKELAVLGTTCGHVQNMIKDVTLKAFITR